MAKTDFAQQVGSARPMSERETTELKKRSPLTVGILLWPYFPLMSLSGLVESLRHAGDHGDASQNRYTQWDILGAPGKSILSSCGIPINATAAYNDPRNYDYIFVIGGLLQFLHEAPNQHRAYLKRVNKMRRPIVGVCTGTFVLAEEGLLDGKPVCIHPYHEQDFRARFRHHRMLPHREYVTQDHVTSVLGGVSIMSLMAEIIGLNLGPDRSAKTVHQMTLPTQDISAHVPQRHSFKNNEITDPRIQKALVILDAEATNNPRMTTLARSLGLSERHFLRLFRKQVGQSPKSYLIASKLRSAVWMLRNTQKSITEVAYTTGFSSGANLADHCQKKLGSSPKRIRHP
jgi:transcriptional regulator GlxA family with amidase domain